MVVVEDLFTAAFEDLIFDQTATVLVATLHTTPPRVIGYALAFDHFTFFANGKVAWVEEIMVEDSFRRLRVGTELMNAVERWAESRRARLIALATRRAAHFYTALGYRESAAYFQKSLVTR